MKKIILGLLFVGVVILSTPLTANAMGTKDMKNKVYKVQVSTSYDNNNPVVQQAGQTGADMGDQIYYLFTGKRGKCVTLQEKGNKKKIQKMLKSKKYANKQIEESGLTYSIKNGKFDIDEDNSEIDEDDLITLNTENCDPIKEDGNGGFSIHYNPSEGMSNLGVTGMDYNISLANKQYGFKM